MRDIPHKHVKVVADPFLLIYGISWSAVVMAMWIFFFFAIRSGAIKTATDPERISGQWGVGIIGAGFVAAVLACLPRWLAIITMTESSVEYRAAFKKTTRRPYSQYPYVSRAGYNHGIGQIGYQRSFIVLSDRKLSEDELQHINRVGVSSSVIKFRYQRKTFEKLCGILPDKQRYRLERCFPMERISN